MSAPVGNKNAAKSKRLIGDCIKRELTQRPNDVLAIVNKAIEQAIQGDMQARSWLAERSDGKVPQPVVGGDEDDPPIKAHHTVEYIGAPATAK
jgi:hypothetical protein